MGQIEVYNWLLKAQSVDNRFYCIKEIQNGLRVEGLSNGSIDGVSGDLLRLTCSNYLDSTTEGNIVRFKRLFKLKDKYLTIQLKK